MTKASPSTLSRAQVYLTRTSLALQLKFLGHSYSDIAAVLNISRARAEIYVEKARLKQLGENRSPSHLLPRERY